MRTPPLLASDVTHFTARARISLNGMDYALNGGGIIEPDKGLVIGDYTHDLAANDNIDSLIFQTVLVTGYPSVCRHSEDRYSPFDAGDYSYVRTVDFARWGHIEYEARCRQTADGRGVLLDSEFDVRGILRVPALEAAVRVGEIWSQEMDAVRSHFSIAWPMADGGGTVVGRATSHYQTAVPARLPTPTNRQIVFHSAVRESNRLHIVQESWLE